MVDNKETVTMSDKNTVYVLELMGDVSNTGGTVTVEVLGTSLDLKRIEDIMVEKTSYFDDLFKPDGLVSNVVGKNTFFEPEDEEDDNEICYQNTDFTSLFLTITSYELL
jgi:hypothetical protein